MKYALTILILLLSVLIGTACENQNLLPTDDNENGTDENDQTMRNTIAIKVEEKIFTATLLENDAATAFIAMLPLEINMTELNGNEKYFRLSKNLPTHASNPGTINSGDLMLWGANTLVIFYQAFSTSYSYTKLGKIDSPAGLAAAVGSGNVTVTIKLNRE